MAPDAVVLFDFTNQPLHTVRDLIVIGALAVWGSFLLLRSDEPNGQKAAAAIVTVGFLGWVSFLTLRTANRHETITAAIAAGDVTEFEGVVRRRRRDGDLIYVVGARALDVSWRHPALDRGDEWMAERLVNRCARFRITEDGDIVWVALQPGGCGTQESDAR
jgi:hypothetical protein